MEIIHIVATSRLINFGVWNSALSCKEELAKLGVHSYFWTCDQDERDMNPNFHFLDLKQTSPLEFVEGLQKTFETKNTLMVTHGAWLAPTKLGYYAQKFGFKWVYVPHGMLEPWSLRQNRLFKTIYFQLFEKRYTSIASLVRAVGLPEKIRLSKKLKKKVEFIPNAVPKGNIFSKSQESILFIFIARLHFKKGILPLVKAWNSQLKGNYRFQLKIAGPDEGELEKIKPFLNENTEYLGSVYGENKIELLKSAHYYFLPSFSEGFPTSVLEAMSFGAIPLISEGCNFKEVFDNQLGFKAEPDQILLENLLKEIINQPYDQEKSNNNVRYINEFYSESVIAKQLYNTYLDLINQS